MCVVYSSMPCLLSFYCLCVELLVSATMGETLLRQFPQMGHFELHRSKQSAPLSLPLYSKLGCFLFSVGTMKVKRTLDAMENPIHPPLPSPSNVVPPKGLISAHFAQHSTFLSR